MRRSTFHQSLMTLSAAMMAALATGAAFGAVKREGDWPDVEKTVSLDLNGESRSVAVQRIAEAAGWNVVVHAPPGEPLDIHVKDQPAVKVLELVLGDGTFVAKREGNLIDISPGEGSKAALPIPPPPPPLPVPTAAPRHAEDRVVSGGSLRIEKGDVADDVTVMGGNLDVFGDVEGDLVVMGGSATVHEGAHVHGDATTIGGSLNVEDGAIVDGDVEEVGGLVNGKLHAEKRGHNKAEHAVLAKAPWYRDLWSDIGSALARSALLFVFGTILLSLASSRMDLMKQELVARPMRVFAIGALSMVLLPLVIAVLCITVIGIPIAVVAALALTFGGYAGVCAVLATVGKALLAHRTDNQHVHLAAGCAIFLLLGAIPGLGALVTVVVALMGLGALMSTRLAGYAPAKTTLPADGPYRMAT
jgi:hypothetical protein